MSTISTRRAMITRTMHAVMADRNRCHVIPYRGKWIVRRADRTRASRVFATKADAVRLAKRLATESRGELIVHGTDGRLVERHVFKTP